MSFISKAPELEDYWRAIILFGRNVASYKFALAKSLLEIQPESGQLIKMSELAPVFARQITEHLKISDKQATSRSSTFLDYCRDFNAGKTDQNHLLEQTVKYGFVNVIDAFHIVATDEISKRFYIDERKKNDGIRITEEFSELVSGSQITNLPHEVESRWNLVETAWELGISRNMIRIDFDSDTERFFTFDDKLRRKSITSSRDALNGYQKGHCFYCFDTIHLDKAQDELPDVDHFFPHALKQYGMHSVDGIWNLVLACKDCNRGTNGKFEKIPTIKLLERLNKRNEFLISSHHPLRETLIQQTGNTPQRRSKFLNDYHNDARARLIHTWEAELKAVEVF